MRKLIHKSKGFTLIELMIVILIIAILVGIAIPVYLAAQANARTRTCQANLRTIEGAINTYFADTLLYPNVISVMDGTVLKKIPECESAPYSLAAGAAGAPPTVSCPQGDPGHTL
jgi:type IV pilus assembly protein PilA